MDKVTPEALMTFFWVAAALIAFALAIWALIEKIKAARKPHDDLVKWQRETDDKLAADRKRLDSLEEGQRVVLRGLGALISHGINGNSIEKLNASQQEIINYLIDR